MVNERTTIEDDFLDASFSCAFCNQLAHSRSSSLIRASLERALQVRFQRRRRGKSMPIGNTAPYRESAMLTGG